MKVCRTCLQVLNNDASCLLVDTEDLSLESPSIRSKLIVCVPELAVDIVQCAVICTSCSEALNTAYNFKNKCLQTEEKILNYTQFTGCNADTVNIFDVVQFGSLNTDCDSMEGKQLNDVHYPITQIIEHDSDVDIKPVAVCNTPGDDHESYVYEPEAQTVNVKVETDDPDCMIVNNGINYPLPNSVFFSPELDVEIKSYSNKQGIDFYSQGVHFPQGSQFSQSSENVVGQNRVCMYCQKSFTLGSELEAHLMTHMENRPLKCTMCERRFVRKDKLQLHMRIHTGEKPFECNLCGRCFSRKDKLNNHIRTHTGEKPHQCILCQKSFARKDKMNTHMRSQHWLALANLEITVVKNSGLTNATEQAITENATGQ